MCPQALKAQIRVLAGAPRTAGQYKKEIALLWAQLEPYERERRAPAVEKGHSSPHSVPVPAASIPKYTILQWRHTQIRAEEKEEVRLAECLTTVQPVVRKCVP